MVYVRVAFPDAVDASYDVIRTGVLHVSEPGAPGARRTGVGALACRVIECQTVEAPSRIEVLLRLAAAPSSET